MLLPAWCVKVMFICDYYYPTWELQRQQPSHTGQCVDLDWRRAAIGLVAVLRGHCLCLYESRRTLCMNERQLNSFIPASANFSSSISFRLACLLVCLPSLLHPTGSSPQCVSSSSNNLISHTPVYHFHISHIYIYR